MKKIFIVKGMNPIWDLLEYDEYGEYKTKDDAKRQKRHLQCLGFKKVCIKQLHKRSAR